MEIVKRPVDRHATVVSNLLVQNNYVFVCGKRMTHMLSTNVDEVVRFKHCWNHLERDRYMADGGAYRYRRYGQFVKTQGARQISVLPHEPYSQPSAVNPLNGDIARHFEPLSDRFLTSPILEKLLLLLSDVYDLAEGEARKWNIRLHPYRIVANDTQIGKPTPEGLHRDGVNYIASLMISKINVAGGETTITDNNGDLLEALTLEKTFDLVLANDDETMHQVSTISPQNLGKCAYRDVLVVAFTKMES